MSLLRTLLSAALANVYRRQVAMFKRIPFLTGTIAWVLVDFRSPRRPLAGIQDFFNRKGLSPAGSLRHRRSAVRGADG